MAFPETCSATKFVNESGYRQPAQTDFASHFPEAGDTEQSVVGAVIHELTCVGAEGNIGANKPKKGVRIE